MARSRSPSLFTSLLYRLGGLGNHRRGLGSERGFRDLRGHQAAGLESILQQEKRPDARSSGGLGGVRSRHVRVAVRLDPVGLDKGGERP